MGKKLIITEKPSVAREFARVLGEPMKNHGEYLESENYIITLMDIELIGTDRGIGQHIALNKKTQIPRPFAYMNELEEMREAYKNVIYTYEDHD